MVQGRRHESPGGTRSAGMVLAAALLMVTVTQTRGKSQLSIVEDINKSLENILRDVESLQQYIDPTTTTPRETTAGGASTPEISPETSSEFSVSTSMTTDVDSSSSEVSDAPTDTTATTSRTSTTATTAESSSSTTPDATSSTSTTIVSTTTIVPTTTTTITVPTTTSTTTVPTTTTTDNVPTTTTTTTVPTTTITITVPTTTTTTTVPTTTTTDNVPTTTTTTSVPTTTTTDNVPTTTTTTTVSTTTTTTTVPTMTTTTTTPVPTTNTTTTPNPGGPKPRDRVKRRNLLSLATPDDALRAWVDPRIVWLEDGMPTETSDITSDITSSEYTMTTSISATTPVSDLDRLDAALWEVDQVVRQVADGTITEDQLGQMQAAEAEVEDVTAAPDEALQAELLGNQAFIDDRIERIQNDQATIDETIAKLEKHKTAVIIGSVLGGLMLIVVVAVGAVCYRRHMKKKKNGGRATAKKRSQSASGSAQQQMVELGSSLDEIPPPSMMPPNPLIPRANLDNFSLSSAQRNSAQESTRAPDHEPSTQVGEMRTEPGIENPGYVEEIPPRPVVPPKPRKRPSTFDNFGLSPSQMRIDQEPSEAHFESSEQDHYIDEINYRLSPRERQVRPRGGIYDFPMEPSRDPSLRHHQRHQHPRDHRDHRMRHRNDRHVRRTPSVPPPDYTIPRSRHQSPDNFIDRKHSSQRQQPQRSPYEFEPPRRPSAPPKSEVPRPERNRSDIRRPYGPEDLY